jgi:kinesin family protein 6/9
MKVTNVPIVNQAQDQNLLIKKYEREIRDLKQELTLHDVLAAGGVDIEAAEPYNAEQQYSI